MCYFHLQEIHFISVRIFPPFTRNPFHIQPHIPIHLRELTSFTLQKKQQNFFLQHLSSQLQSSTRDHILWDALFRAFFPATLVQGHDI